MRSAPSTLLHGSMLLLLSIAALWSGCSGRGDSRAGQNRGTPIPLEPFLVIDQWTPAGSSEGSDYVYKPGSVALDDTGKIYVLDSLNQRVVVFSPAGNHLFSFGRPGQGPGEFRFGRDGGDDIAVVGGKIITLEKQLGHIQVFDHAGNYVSSFSVPRSATSMAADISSIYISVFAREAGEPTTVEFDYDGNQKRSLGSAQFSENLRLFNRHSIGVDGRGRVREAFMFFPLLRTFDETGEVANQWYDLSWWEDRELASFYLSGRNRKEAFESLGVGGPEADRQWPNFGEIPPDLRLRILSQDIEYLGGVGVWVTQMFGGVVQGFSDDGMPLEAYMLAPPADREHRSGARDIGASPDGKTICEADIKYSVVRCFRVTEGWR